MARRREYDPRKPLYSIHIPKCGGSSLRLVLAEWFGDRFHTHYYQTNNAPPAVVPAGAGTCVHGHFNRVRGIGLLDYYPDAGQVVTVLRDPLEAALSNYFFWKSKARKRQLELGAITEGSEHDYRDIDDFFRKRPLSHIPDFMPLPVTGDNYRQMIDRYFIYVGFLEDAEGCIEGLAAALGFPSRTLERKNPSFRDEELSPALLEQFLGTNRLALEIYRYARESFPPRS